MIVGFEIAVFLIAAITIGVAWGYLIGVQSKRAPKPRKHSHDWGKWDNHKTVRVVTRVDRQLMGYQYFYIRECATCGEREHEMKEIL